jgi:heme/copper-type cytochrome/quinol oxidase subunit 3
MSAEVHATNSGVDNRKFAMWTLIASECFLFGTLITNYMINRSQTKGGLGGVDIFDIDLTTLSTFDLLMSSVAMVLALQACKEKQLRKFQFWTAIVVLGGAIFLGFQYYEFSHFVHKGLGLSTNNFGSSFYMLTGCHGLHVAVGVMIMSSILITSLIRGDKWFDSDVVEICGLYWHFVDVVWIIIFTVVYLFVYI